MYLDESDHSVYKCFLSVVENLEHHPSYLNNRSNTQTSIIH